MNHNVSEHQIQTDLLQSRIDVANQNAYSSELARHLQAAEEKLLPCHRCGAKLTLVNTWTPSYWVECTGCLAEVHFANSVEVSSEQHLAYQKYSRWPLPLVCEALNLCVAAANLRPATAGQGEQ